MRNWKLGAATLVAAAIATPSFAASGPPSTAPGNSGKAKQEHPAKQERPAKGTTGATGATGATGTTGATGPSQQPSMSPAKACKGLSKKHVKGQKGTPFSRCVVAAAKLKGQPTGPTGPTGPIS